MNLENIEFIFRQLDVSSISSNSLLGLLTIFALVAFVAGFFLSVPIFYLLYGRSFGLTTFGLLTHYAGLVWNGMDTDSDYLYEYGGFRGNNVTNVITN